MLGLLLLGGAAHSTPDITGSAHQVRGLGEEGALQRKSYLCIPRKEIAWP